MAKKQPSNRKQKDAAGKISDEVLEVIDTRFQLGLSRRELAKLAGISVGMLSRIERGESPGSSAAMRQLTLALNGLPVEKPKRKLRKPKRASSKSEAVQSDGRQSTVGTNKKLKPIEIIILSMPEKDAPAIITKYRNTYGSQIARARRTGKNLHKYPDLDPANPTHQHRVRTIKSRMKKKGLI